MRFPDTAMAFLVVAALTMTTSAMALEASNASQCQAVEPFLINMSLENEVNEWADSIGDDASTPLLSQHLSTAIACSIAPPVGHVVNHLAAKKVPLIFRFLDNFLQILQTDSCLPLHNSSLCQASDDDAKQNAAGGHDQPLAEAVTRFMGSQLGSNDSLLEGAVRNLIAYGMAGERGYRIQKTAGDRLRGICSDQSNVEGWSQLADQLANIAFHTSAGCGPGQSLNCDVAENLPACLFRFAAVANLTAYGCRLMSWKRTPLDGHAATIKTAIDAIDAGLASATDAVSSLVEASCGNSSAGTTAATAAGVFGEHAKRKELSTMGAGATKRKRRTVADTNEAVVESAGDKGD